jgi:alcohol dehydrogenase class IV
MARLPFYSFQAPNKIVAGVNSIEHIYELVHNYQAKNVVIITDPGVWRAGLVDKPKAILESAGILVDVVNNVPSEPELAQVKEIFHMVEGNDYQLIIGMGGGSSMDVAKIVAVLMTNDCKIEDILGVDKIRKRGIPTLMIPTTAGTGAEATAGAIVTLAAQELKVGVVSNNIIPNSVIIDPKMTENLPPAITASTGMDAFTHALECYISTKANPFSDALALRAIRLIYKSLPIAYEDGANMEARHNMMIGALFGGMCIALSGTAAVHALAYPLGGKYKIPHGISNAMLLPYVMEFNLDVVEDKFTDVATEMGLDVYGFSKKQTAKVVLESIYDLVNRVNIPSDLKQYGISYDDLDGMAEAASKVTRLLKNNPKKLSKEDMKAIYKRLL